MASSSKKHVSDYEGSEIPQKRRRTSGRSDASRVLSLYAVNLSDAQKSRILHFMLETKIPYANAKTVNEILLEHRIHNRFTYDKNTAILKLRAHHCDWQCLVRTSDASEEVEEDEHSSAPVSRVYAKSLSDDDKTECLRHFLLNRLSTAEDSRLISLALEHELAVNTDTIDPIGQVISSLKEHTCKPSCLIRTEDLLTGHVESHGDSEWRDTKEEKADEEDRKYWQGNWPQVEDQSTLDEVLQEFVDNTSGRALRTDSCSFCNSSQTAKYFKKRRLEELDISLLEQATAKLQVIKGQPLIQTHRLIGGLYNVCSTCWSCVRNGKFIRVPTFSWANGCWIGDVPQELAHLTYAEELVISRAHTTKCWMKLNGRGRSRGASTQRAASGNVCIHPHEITQIATRLPRPMNELYDEIIVIFVSEDKEATEKLFKRTPLIVRRGYILRALQWLQQHNPLYHDIEIDWAALAEYPTDDNGCIPFPVNIQTPNSTLHGQSATYTGHGIDTTEAIFATQDPDADHNVPMSVTGTFDVDKTEVSLNIRKLDALRYLKSNQPFVKTSTSSDTMNVRDNPSVYGMLWPTLFPYGVGLFEDPVRETDGFQDAQLYAHVKHCLTLADRRFQTHLSFIFVMHNILMMRRSAYRSRLAVRRAWWPLAMNAMKKISVDIVEKVHRDFLNKKARKDYTKYEAKTENEKAVMDVLRYVEYIDDHIEGSTGEVTKMREEIRALSRQSGTPSIFFTLNPADTHNPITSFLAGHDIDVDAPFNRPDSRYTPFHRARILANNPIAGCKFFHTISKQFIETLLGFKRKSRRGIFGHIKHYYGVVEAQNRGSLHLHILLWLEGALSPRKIQERCANDDSFKRHLFQWLESTFHHSLPPGTVSIEGPYDVKKRCLLGRPPNPNMNEFHDVCSQYLREVLDASDQQHKHSDTCFKKTTRTIGSLNLEEQDALCRFNLPGEIVEQTYIDEDGMIHIKRLDRFTVGYNPTSSMACQCNTDAKFIGSGPLGMALGIYMTNYTAKSSLDSAVVVSALTAAISNLETTENGDNRSMDEEKCRRLLMKTLNQMNARRELSAQQVASSLLGYPNHFTDCQFTQYYWSNMLQWLSPTHFPKCANKEEDIGEEDRETEQKEEDDFENENDSENENDNIIIINDCDTPMPPVTWLVYDIFYRSTELETTTMWDILCEYEKRPMKATNTFKDVLINLRSLNFMEGHPQYTTHILKRRSTHCVPVLVGQGIPRRDLSADHERYAIAMLALFKPWRRDMKSPLKEPTDTWSSALETMLVNAPQSYLDLMDHVQEQWECRQAADIYSEKLNKETVLMPNKHDSNGSGNFGEEVTTDLGWQFGQEDVGGNYDLQEGQQDVEEEDTFLVENAGGKSSITTRAAISLAKQANLYATSTAVSNNDREQLKNSVQDVGSTGRTFGLLAASNIANERAVFTDNRSREQRNYVQTATQLPSSPVTRVTQDIESKLTTLEKEKENARHRLLHRKGDDTLWKQLDEWQKEVIGICSMFTLNRKQRIAFLLIADNHIKGMINRSKPPFRFILGGPGGTGKSHIYNAVKLFLHAIGRPYDLAFTAPTGIAAANIGGSTIYSELSLSTKYETLLKPRSKTLPKLTERLSLLRGMFVDEIYFFGSNEMERMSRNINLARGCNDDPFGYMDVMLSGDEFQLPGPKTIPLFSHLFESLLTATSSLQPLSEETRRALVGFKNFRTFDKCVVLDTLVRQWDDRFVDLLHRLRRGNCTTEGPDSDLAYLKSFCLPLTGSRAAEPDVLKWVSDPEHASPLITYTNTVRDAHNWNMTKAFASASGQEFMVYYADDSVGKGSERTILTGQNAMDAWGTSIKANAHDLSGRLPLAIGMPIIVVDNIAVELGISNGSRGSLRGIKYFTRENRRYAVSIDVDLPGYTNPDPKAEHPHRITIPTVTKSIQFTSSATGKTYTARRQQAPVIAGFAFTVHNSQSQSLKAATIHLESSVSAASSYVMLSRIQCGKEGPTGLHILGDVNAKQIATHAAQEVRDEEKRLLAMSERTIREAADTLSWYSRTGEEL